MLLRREDLRFLREDLRFLREALRFLRPPIMLLRREALRDALRFLREALRDLRLLRRLRRLTEFAISSILITNIIFDASHCESNHLKEHNLLPIVFVVIREV